LSQAGLGLGLVKGLINVIIIYSVIKVELGHLTHLNPLSHKHTHLHTVCKTGLMTMTINWTMCWNKHISHELFITKKEK